jgi:hypothetical protein
MRVMYYPDLEPPARWLRPTLLFFDQVVSLVPRDAHFKPSNQLEELTAELPTGFTTIAPAPVDVELDEPQLRRLSQIFQRISERPSPQGGPGFTVEFDNTGGVSFPGYTFIYGSKMSASVRQSLERFGLLRHDIRELARSVTDMQGRDIVAREAADVVVSTVADAVATRLGWDTATDQRTHFLLTSLNALVGDEYRARNRGLLVSSLLEASIPSEVAALDVRTYKTIRDEFAGVRGEFARAVTVLSALHRIDDITDAEVLRDRVEEVTRAFGAELEKARRTVIWRHAKRWVPWAVSSLATLGSAAGLPPPWNFAGAGVAISASLAAHIFVRPESETERLRRLIVTMGQEIDYQRQLQELL